MPAAKGEANFTELVPGYITQANRAPHSKDKGLVWIEETGGTTKFYTRNRVSGTWTLIGPP